MLENANVFITGGAGTLGRAIARRRAEDGWRGKLTVYSTDDHKHAVMRKNYPDVQYIQGDILDFEGLVRAMAGHDVVIHAAAVKVIPTSEFWSINTYDVNVTGSRNVFTAAVIANVAHVLAISTDKACHPANAYGCSKMMMEKMAQEFARVPLMDTEFHLVRYGNVLESTGSVIEAWKKSVAAREQIKITNPAMTRFWLSPRQAVQYVVESFEFPSGHIYIPQMPALSIGKLAEYVVGHKNYTSQRIDLRPGEKFHETLLTIDELDFALEDDGYYELYPSTHPRFSHDQHAQRAYTSDIAPELTRKELLELLDD